MHTAIVRVAGRLGALAMLVLVVAACESDRGGEMLAPLLFTPKDEATETRYGEPNDTTLQALDIPTNNTPVLSAFHRMKDVDYYRFVAAQGANYIVETLDLEAGVLTNIELRDRDDRAVTPDTVGSPAPGAMRIVWKARSAGQFYVRVSSVEGGRVGTYKLRISVGADSYEPDNSISTARMIIINGDPQQRTLHDQADADYIKFAGWADFGYHITVEAAGSAEDISVSVFDAAGNAIGSSFDAASSTVTVTAPTNGSHFIRVAPKNDAALGTYTISVTPGDDPLEPDSTLAQARSIATNGTWQRHSFSSSRDQDYIKFETQAGVAYLIRTDSLSYGVDTQIALVKSTPQIVTIDSDDNGGGGWASALTLQADQATWYYVLVSSANAGKPGHYVVSVKR